MPEQGEGVLERRPKTRIVKAPAVRQAELIDCAQQLFLSKGYEKTTINDVIAATGLSKGAFYHHFRAKEDLLEAIAARFGGQALANVASLDGGPPLNALERLNRLLAMGREWKMEHLPVLRAMFITLLQPENGVLYHRIVGAVFNALAPALSAIIEQGVREGVFDVADVQTATDTLLWLAENRRAIAAQAIALAEAGALEPAIELIMRRVRAEEATVDRILGLPPRSVAFIGAPDELRVMMAAWNAAPAG
jgi:AcrR family transcriptional regulator